MKQRLHSNVAIDLRGLALLRIGLGAILVLDLLSRLRSFGAHYGADGVLSREAYFAEFEKTWHISLHLLTSSDAVNLGLFIIAIVFGLMMAVGYRTRLATVVSWALLISMHSRNPFVLQGGDEVLRALLFWSMFLPLGARFSIDRALGTGHDAPPPGPLVSMATLCLVGQVVLLYAFASGSKTAHPVWWQDGLGVHFALGVEQFTTRIGLWLRDSGGLTTLLTYTTLVLQAAAPVLLLTPIFRDRIRTLLPLVMIGLHVGFALTMELGFFSYIVIVMWLALLSPAALDRIEKRLPDLGPWLREKRLSLSKRTPFSGSARPIRPTIATTDGRTTVVYNAALATLFALVCWWNFAEANRDVFRMQSSAKAAVEVVRLDQRWKMFSNPPRWSQWYIVTAVLATGEELDVRTGKAPSFEKPSLVSATFASQRWRKYLGNLSEKRGSPHRKHFAEFVCRRFNGTATSGGFAKAAAVRLRMMRQATPHRPGLERLPPDRVVLGSWPCAEASHSR